MELVRQPFDEIMREFRMNGKNVDYVELDLDAIELDRYAPDARSLIIGLLQDSGLEPEMKIIRPPSKTPLYLRTSAVNLMRRQLYPPQGYSLRNPNLVQGMCMEQSHSYVVSMTNSFSQLALSDRVRGGEPNFMVSTSPTLPGSGASSRPIYGTGSSMKPNLAGFKNRLINYENRALTLNVADPGSVESSAITPLQNSLETLIIPMLAISTEKANEPAVVMNRKWRNWYEYEGSSEDDISISIESADSGNFTGEEMSPGSDLSSTNMSTSGESDAPSYASILNTSAIPRTNIDVRGEPSSTSTPKSHSNSSTNSSTPKSRPTEDKKSSKVHFWNQKKSRRASEAGTGSHEETPRVKECVFCKTNGETSSLYRGHVLKDEQGRTVCHVLQKYVCPLCGATGKDAHTVKYCPKNSNPPAVSMMTTLKSMRSATGNVRMMSSSRRTRSSAKRNHKRSMTGATHVVA